MVKINLLPASMLSQRKRQQAQLRLVLVSGLVMAVLVAGLGILYLKTIETANRLAVVSTERAAVDAEIEQYSIYMQMQGQVDSRINLLKQAMGAPLPWVEALEQIGGVIPPNVWLTDLLISAGKEGENTGQLTLRGLTYDHPSTARWVTALRDVEGITDVWVIFSAEETAQEQELIRFEVRAWLLAGTEYDPLAERGEGQ